MRPLTLSFERVLQRVAAASNTKPGRTLAAFAFSILAGEEFDLSQIDQLEDESDRFLCSNLFSDCMSLGLSEEERREAFAAFEPFIQIHVPGTRH